DDDKGDDDHRDNCRRHDDGERRRHHCDDDEDEVDRTVIRLGGCKEFDKARGRAVFEDWDHRDDVFRVTVHDVDLPEDTELTVRVEGRKAGTFELDDEGDGHLTRRDDDLPKFLRLDGDERVTVSRTTDDEDDTKVVLSAACADHHGDGD
ncbi:MAG TPA: hypothetical protein VGJ32_13030, partial [Solirubrobacteraceae bacterium]